MEVSVYFHFPSKKGANMKLSTVILLQLLSESVSFSVGPLSTSRGHDQQLKRQQANQVPRTTLIRLFQSTEDETEPSEAASSVLQDVDALTPEEKKEVVGNLVADDEWEGLGMELTELVRVAVLQDLKQNARDFLGKDDYKLGDISKEIDDRVKTEVAKVRGKDEYELGDFVMAMDEMSKSMTEDLTGKPYEAGDLSMELDTRIKSAVADFCGKEEYEFGDLSLEIDSRVKKRVASFTGKDDYEFGDM